jgi:dipeptidyl aminopeptidase/acylaminoacyl peptidase
VPVTKLDTQAGETAHAFPSFLPDGKHFVYLAATAKNSGGAVKIASLDSPAPTRLLDAATNARFAQGRLLFMKQTTLLAQRFDPARLTLDGEPESIAEGVQVAAETIQVGAYTVSETGVLVVQSGAGSHRSQLAWVDRTGDQIALVGEQASYGAGGSRAAEMDLSPDGSRVAVTMYVWILDTTRGTPTRLTFDAAEDRTPVWSPDASRVVFRSIRNGRSELLQRLSNGIGAEEILTAVGIDKIPESWSPDGRFVVYQNVGPTSGSNANDLWVLPMSPDAKPFPLVQSPFSERRSRFSPDGRFVAYDSNESGRFEIYVTTFPDGRGKWQVSSTGGTEPRWRADGRELFYISGINKLMAATVSTAGSQLTVGASQPLFDIHRPASGLGVYDVSPDGQRFLVNTTDERSNANTLTVIVNWPSLLK